MDSVVKKLKYVLIPGSMPEPQHLEYHQKAIKCWQEVWELAYKEVGIEKVMHTDSFTRQDYVGCIFYEDRCVALSFFRWVDSRTYEFAKDSYFSNWNREHLDMLCSRGSRIIVCSQFTVHPDARGDKLGVSGKDLLMGMIVETFMNTAADGMTGAVRVNRKVNDAGERWGAYIIERAVDDPEFGPKISDLIGFFKDYISSHAKPVLADITVSLWQNKLVIKRQNVADDFDKIISINRKTKKAS